VNWAIASTVVLVAALGGLILAYERGNLSSRTLGLVAALAGLAVAGRLAFAPLPNVKPTTDVILIAGFALGARAGFTTGAITALVSNMVFGQGPWTPWQMFAWGMTGVLGAVLASATGGRISRWGLALAGAFAGLAFGAVMDVSQWLLYGGTPRESTLIAYSLTSLPWNIAHALGNAAFALAFGPALIGAVQRAKSRSTPEWLPRGVPFNSAAVPLAALAIASGLVPTGGHGANSSAINWLLNSQQADGGFPIDPRSGGSSPRETGWAALALAASGRDLAGLKRKGGRSVVQRLEADSRNLFRDTADSPEERPGYAQRLLLAASAAGANPRDFGGRDLIKLVRSGITRSGAVKYLPGDPSVDLTAYAVMALRGAGVSVQDPAVRRASNWLARERQRGGGWSTAPRSVAAGVGTPDTTGAVLQALRAAGRGKDRAVTAGLAFLSRTRTASGGWGFGPGGANAQSTALAVLGLRAWSASAASRSSGWFEAARGPGGSIRFQQGGGSQTPVWVTAQALLALSGRTLPLAPPVGVADKAQRNRTPRISTASSPPTKQAVRPAGRSPKTAAKSADLRFAMRVAEAVGRVAAVLAKSFSGADR
jgi:energy-coupling factor transport system substrate-specific component